jgi:hypothetical protein
MTHLFDILRVEFQKQEWHRKLTEFEDWSFMFLVFPNDKRVEEFIDFKYYELDYNKKIFSTILNSENINQDLKNKLIALYI